MTDESLTPMSPCPQCAAAVDYAAAAISNFGIVRCNCGLISQFDMYAQPELTTEWEYCLDDHEQIYGALARWPFCHDHQDMPKKGRVTRQLPGKKGRPGWWRTLAGIRLAPNAGFRAWRNHYVLLWDTHDGTRAEGRLELYLRAQGEGGVVTHCDFELDLSTLAITQLTCAEAYRPQFEAKVAKVATFLRAALAERDQGLPKPATAHEFWVAEQRALARAADARA